MTPVAEVDRMRGDEMIQIVVDLTSIVVIVRGGMIGDDEVSCKHVRPASGLKEMVGSSYRLSLSG